MGELLACRGLVLIATLCFSACGWAAGGARGAQQGHPGARRPHTVGKVVTGNDASIVTSALMWC